MSASASIHLVEPHAGEQPIERGAAHDQRHPSISDQTVVATLQSMCNERGRRSLSSFDIDRGYAISQDESRARLAS
jgi:hypothetical protein